MSDTVIILLCCCGGIVIFPAFIGLLTAIIIAFPILNTSARKYTIARHIAGWLSALVAFSIVFGISTYLWTEWPEVALDYTPQIRREVWLREMTLPSLMPECYSSDKTVCEETDDLIDWENYETFRWVMYLVRVGLGFYAGATSFKLVWWGTRRVETAPDAAL